MYTKEEYLKLKAEVNKIQQAYLDSLPKDMPQMKKYAKMLNMLTNKDLQKKRLLERMDAVFEPTLEERTGLATPKIKI